MKKVILLAAILLSFSFSYCQNYYKVYAVTSGTWNSYSRDYDWGDDEKTDMEITMKGRIIFVSDKAKSTYTTYKEIPMSTTSKIQSQTAWWAYDESLIKCVVKLIHYRNGMQMLYVIYDNIAVGYYFTSQSFE